MDWLGAHKSGDDDILEVLEFGSTPHLPECQSQNDVLIKVHYTDVNPTLDKQRIMGDGSSKRADVLNAALGNVGPMIPGHGGSGIVESGGPPQLMGKQVCFFAPNGGSYASHVVVDSRCVAELPTSMDMEQAAAIPVSGLTAVQILRRLGLADHHQLQISDDKDGTFEHHQPYQNGNTNDNRAKTMLIVGASGGVGSWLMTLMQAWHPHVQVTATASTTTEWCKQLGATKVIPHDVISSQLEPNTMDYVVCLTEPTERVYMAMIHAIQPFGSLALLVGGKSLANINLQACFDKSLTVVTHSIFNTTMVQPADDIKLLVRLLTNQTIQVPLSPDITNDDNNKLSCKFKDTLKPNAGILHHLYTLPTPPRQGKYVLQITSGDSLIFLDFKTGAIFGIPRKEVVARKLLTKATTTNNQQQQHWKEQAKLEEKTTLLEKIGQCKSLGIVKVADKQATDYEDGLQMQEAENVKNLWGVQLKKREKNKAGEEFLFVDPRWACLGELSRKASIEKGILTPTTLSDGGENETETLEQVVDVTDEQRSEWIQEIRLALKIGQE